MHELRLEILKQRVSLSTDDAAIANALRTVFGAFATEFSAPVDLVVHAHREEEGFRVRTSSGATVECSTLSELVYVVDKDLTVEVQRRRPDLLFVHAAVLQRGSQAILLAGDSGSGKSTTAWGLTRLGFGFMSDELAPIDPASRIVEAFPRALGLKRVLDGVSLPAAALSLERTIHVPTTAFPTAPPRSPVATICFVQHDSHASVPRVRPISPAETAARMYVHCLNALAHAAAGIDAVASIALRVRGYALTAADLAGTCRRVDELVRSA